MATKPWLRRLSMAVGGQLAVGLVVSVVQLATIFARLHSITVGPANAMLMLVMGIPFNTGGYTVRLMFESLVRPLEPWFGHRTATVLSNLNLYLLLLALQVAIVAIPVALRYRRVKTLKDPVIGAIAALLLLNGLVNITWPWWGT